MPPQAVCSCSRARSAALCDESPHHSAALGDGLRGREFRCRLAGASGSGSVCWVRWNRAGLGWAGVVLPGPRPCSSASQDWQPAAQSRGCRGPEGEHPSQSPSTHACPWKCSAVTLSPAILCHSSEKGPAQTEGGASRTAPQGVTPGWRPIADGQPCPRLPRSPTSGLGAAQGPAALPPTLTALAGLPRPLHTG